MSLPYDKQVADWVTEIANSDKVILDSSHEGNSANNVFLRGYIKNWPVFNQLDSIKFFIGKQFGRNTRSINGRIVDETVDTFFFLKEVFYFPLQNLEEKAWKEIHKSLLNEFKKQFGRKYPRGGITQGELIWFTDSHSLPSMPTATIEYGKIKKRSLYFIIMTLNFKTESGG